MRILLLSYNVAFTGGGAFFHALQLGRQLVVRGHQVTLLATSARARWSLARRAIDGLEIYETPALLPQRWRYGYDFYEAWRRWLWVRARRFDIAHAFECRPTVIYPALMAQQQGAKLVIEWLDWFGRGGSVELRPEPSRTLLRPLETYYEENFRHRADGTIVINKTLEARALKLGVSAKTLLRVPHGADLQSLHPVNRLEARRALSLPLEAPLLGYVGSLFQPDADLLMEALRLVQARRPGTQLIMLGNPKARLPGLAGLHLPGFVTYTQLNQYLGACDILCLPFSEIPANRGRFPSKIVDYFAAGRATVAATSGEVHEMIEEGQVGVVTKPTPADFAAGIEALLSDPRRPTMEMAARRLAETRYSWPVIAGQIETLYQRLLYGNDSL